ncbi:hypothetical protein SAMN06298216_3544 [Spirosomataceae bacterium TFI 002]|nr:hypothetical protein SAMN06298216_3544 [Spirosomataceae bacterium TFI 002]
MRNTWNSTVFGLLCSSIFFALSFQSCLQSDGTNLSRSHNTQRISGTKANLFVIASDASASAKSYALNEQNLQQVYEYIAAHGGGRLALIQFKSNSYNQEPMFIEVPSIDTSSHVTGSNFDKTRQVARNHQEIAQYQAAFQLFKQNLVLDKNHSSQFTDIEGGLRLIDNILDGISDNQELIIISDFVNDTPPKHGHDPLIPFAFTSPYVQVHFIRPDEKTIGKPVDSLFTNTASIKKYAAFNQIFFKRP